MFATTRACRLNSTMYTASTLPAFTAVVTALRHVSSTASRTAPANELAEAMWKVRPSDLAVHDLPEYLDEREDAQKAFHMYVSDANDAVVEANSVAGDKVRVPISANSGASGSGKTVQLEILVRNFPDRYKGVGLFMTMNGPHAGKQSFDAHFSVEDRVAHRIIHAALGMDHQAKLGSTIREVYDHMGLKFDPTAYPSITDFDVIGAVREILKMEDKQPLLLAMDELRKFGTHPEVGDQSPEAVNALKYLADLSQHSFVERAKSGKEATYIAASAYSAVDPYKGITEGSGRPVFYLPLPPLRLDAFDKALSDFEKRKGVSKQQKTKNRTALWMNQDNARNLCQLFDRLTKEGRTEEEGRLLRERAAETAAKRSDKDKVSRFIKACEKKQADPATLVRTLFWPQATGDSLLRGFGLNMLPALLGEACGICAILRSEAQDEDSVYMHPGVLKQLCEQLSNSTTAPQWLFEVAKLAELLLKQPEHPNSPGMGKLYEEIMHQMLICRILTSFEDLVSVADLVGRHDGGKLFHADVKVLCPPSITTAEVTAFPDYNGKCSDMPTKAPWYVPPAQLGGTNTVVDSMITLQLAKPMDNKSQVCIANQCKEYREPSDALKGFRQRHHLVNSEQFEVTNFVENYHFVHTLVTPNRVSQPLMPFKRGEHTLHEASISHKDIRKFCPMVAFSGCDARVLKLSNLARKE